VTPGTSTKLLVYERICIEDATTSKFVEEPLSERTEYEIIGEPPDDAPSDHIIVIYLSLYETTCNDNGASGTFCIVAPVPNCEKSDSPYILMAITLMIIF
jgi:hypothetical protein